MPVRFRRRHCRPPAAVGRTEHWLGGLILLLVGGLLAAIAIDVLRPQPALFLPPEEGATGAAGVIDSTTRAGEPQTAAAMPQSAPTGSSQPASTAAGCFPPAEPGWQAPVRIDHFAPDKLYVKIDGRADAYIEHHVMGLNFGTYAGASDPTRLLDVYWYEMTAAADALAMFQSERPPDVPALPLGTGCYQVGGAVFFCRGRSYVQILVTDEKDGPAALRLAQAVAARLPEQ